MADSSPPSGEHTLPSSSMTRITDLNEDVLADCASYLNPQDIANLAMSCTSFRPLAYSNSVWLRLCRDRWPCPQELGVREAYLARLKASHQFRSGYPLQYPSLHTDPKPFDHILMDKKNIFLSQGRLLHTIFINKLNKYIIGGEPDCSHTGRITCMRLFALDDTSFARSPKRGGNVLVTSSLDQSIRVWRKGRMERCFQGHNGPVSTLSDKLLGVGSCRLLASGGEDGTVCLWALNSSGQHALKATLNERKNPVNGRKIPVKLMSVARTSHLVSISSDSKVRVWDISASSAVFSYLTSVTGAPVDMKCHESLVYVGTTSSVALIDLRAKQTSFAAVISQPNLCSFAILPSRSLICTGGDGEAMLWDVRRIQGTLNLRKKWAGHSGPVTHLHMDPYNVVTGGPEDKQVNSWDTDTGMLTNSFRCCSSEESQSVKGCSALAVHGRRIATATLSERRGVVRLWDFSSSREDGHDSLI